MTLGMLKAEVFMDHKKCVLCLQIDPGHAKRGGFSKTVKRHVLCLQRDPGHNKDGCFLGL